MNVIVYQPILIDVLVIWYVQETVIVMSVPV